MRIIAGRFRGRRLAGPVGAAVRPTSDRLRETLFNVLAPRIEGARVLDAFAGTGALGLEAASRGASAVVFIESDRRASDDVATNIDRLGAGGICRLVRGRFPRVSLAGDDSFDLVLLDPPYDIPDLEVVVEAAAPFVAAGGLVVLEHSRRRPSPERAGRLVRTRLLTAGDSALSFYAAAPAAGSP